MEKINLFKLSKRIISIILSLMLLSGLFYIPKLLNSEALAGLPDYYANMKLEKLETLEPNELGKCRGISSYHSDYSPLLITEGTVMHNSGKDGNPVNFINIHWDKRNGMPYKAIYCLEPSAPMLPSANTGSDHNSGVYVDTPNQEGGHVSQSELANIQLEQTKLLSYALSLGQQNYYNVVDSPMLSTNDSSAITTYMDSTHELVRGAATQIIVWAIAQKWYINDSGNYHAVNMGMHKNGSPLIEDEDSGLCLYVKNYPNILRAMKEIWAKLWEAMDADLSYALPGTTQSLNDIDNRTTYFMEWDPDLNNYKIELPAGENLRRYKEKSVTPDNDLTIEYNTTTGMITITGDPGTRESGGVIVELEQIKPDISTLPQRAVVGYIVSEGQVEGTVTTYNPDHQILAVIVNLYDAEDFSDTRAYFKLIRESMRDVKFLKFIEKDIPSDKPYTGNGEDRSGFEFNIFEINNTGTGPKGDPIAHIVTNEKGIAEIKLPAGIYWIKELENAKSGPYYLVNEKIEIRRDDYDTVQDVPLWNMERDILVDKTMERDEDNYNRAGIKFRIYPNKFYTDYKNGNKTWSDIINNTNEDPDDIYFAEEFEIDADGKFTLKKIPRGIYRIVELPCDQNEGYYLIDEKITLTDRGYSIDDGETVEIGYNSADGQGKYKVLIIIPLKNELEPEPTTEEPTEEETTTEETTEEETTEEATTETQSTTEPPSTTNPPSTTEPPSTTNPPSTTEAPTTTQPPSTTEATTNPPPPPYTPPPTTTRPYIPPVTRPPVTPPATNPPPPPINNPTSPPVNDPPPTPSETNPIPIEPAAEIEEDIPEVSTPLGGEEIPNDIEVEDVPDASPPLNVFEIPDEDGPDDYNIDKIGDDDSDIPSPYTGDKTALVLLVLMSLILLMGFVTFRYNKRKIK